MLLNEGNLSAQATPIILPAPGPGPAPMSAPVKIPYRTLEDYAREYLAGTLNKNTRESYAQDLRDFLAATNGDLSDTSLLVYKEMACTELAPRSAKRRLSCIKGFLDYLVLKDVLRRNLYAHLRGKLGPKVDKHDSPTVALTDSEVRQMLAHTGTKGALSEAPESSAARLLGMSQNLCLRLSFGLGLRVSEVTGIRIKDVTSEGLRILGKGSKVRWMALDESMRAAISGYIEACSVTFDRSRSEDEYLVLTQKLSDGSRPIDRNTVNRWYKDIAKECGIEKRVTSHTGRATAITKLLDEEVPLRDVANFAGHTNVETTTLYDKGVKGASLKTVGKIKY